MISLIITATILIIFTILAGILIFGTEWYELISILAVLVFIAWLLLR